MRDKINPKVISVRLLGELESLSYHKEKINTSSSSEGKIRLKDFLIDRTLEITIAKYSLASSKEVVKDALLETITAFEDGFKWLGFKNHYGGYDQMIWLVSLGVLCDIDLDDFKRITAIIKRDGVKDKLLDFIIHSKQSDWPVESYSYIQSSPYQYLNPDGISGAADIKQYLDKYWYKGHKDAAWHDSHKNTQVNIYFGYWAWEAAAIAKIKGIDDAELKDQQYYPYDAVHW